MSQMTEQRVVASKPKIGARPTTAPTPDADKGGADGTKKKGGKKKLLLLVVVGVLVAAAAAWWFLLKPGGEAGEQAAELPPEPGEVLVVEPISLNLAGGHYLRVGLGLQLVYGAGKGGHGEIDSARALDIAVTLFSGRTVEEVSSPEGREALREEMIHQLEEAYHGEVMDLYFTDYVTQ